MAIDHHARVLVQAEALTYETQQGSRQYDPIIDDTLTADVQTVIAVEEHETKATILNAICESTNIQTTTSAIADRLTYDTSTIRHHLNRLESDDLIERARHGEKTTISLSENYADIINRLIVY
ncbi:winged helix-turn-helix domain-containing protein [Halocatena marina]|uniref:winged helix-turn-helix domain-containing protein n=1 Tax=Halocatena marina TaxID=2934937 RepID=UPI00200CE479|nr:winged helix-turn-helix domain-containing protein [Halocatena marina]